MNVRSYAIHDSQTVETIKRLSRGGRTSQLWRAITGPLGAREGGVQTHATAGKRPDMRGCGRPSTRGAYRKQERNTQGSSVPGRLGRR